MDLNTNNLFSFSSVTSSFILRWTRREECDFYRVVSTFGVEKIKKEPGLPEGGEPDFDWNRFRTFARLDKKTDESLSRYFRSFVAMCRRVCHLRPGRGEGNYNYTLQPEEFVDALFLSIWTKCLEAQAITLV